MSQSEPEEGAAVADETCGADAAAVAELAQIRNRLGSFVHALVGEAQAPEFVALILDGAENADAVARAAARSPRFEQVFKAARTLDIGVSSVKAPDPAYVGLADIDCAAPFDENFRAHFAPRLAHRAENFDVIFAALAAQGRKPLIVETGCLRLPGNWQGDGQSTFMFDAFARCAGGRVFSVDITPESIASARRACSHSTQLILNDSVAALGALAAGEQQASLLYLDSFDLDVNNPAPSAIHHILELAAARPLIGPGTIIAVDDFGVGEHGGKGAIVDDFFARSSAEVLFSGYQKVWRWR